MPHTLPQPLPSKPGPESDTRNRKHAHRPPRLVLLIGLLVAGVRLAGELKMSLGKEACVTDGLGREREERERSYHRQ
jgi:hypothetical protein